MFDKDPKMFAYEPLHGYGDARDAVEPPTRGAQAASAGRASRLGEAATRSRPQLAPKRAKYPSGVPTRRSKDSPAASALRRIEPSDT